MEPSPNGKSCNLSGLMQRCFHIGFNMAEEEKAKRGLWKYDNVFCIESDSEDEEVMYEQPKKQAKETTLLLQGRKQRGEEEEDKEEIDAADILNQIDAVLNEKKNIGLANR